MEKIGICTFYNNYNYGSYLQSFALLKKLESLGYDTFIIDFKDEGKKWNRRIKYMNNLVRIKCLLFHPKLIHDILNLKKISRNNEYFSKEQKLSFDSFKDNYLKFYSEDYTKDDFRAFIAGSDQVWKLTLPGLHYVFFLRFTKKKKRISYAASLGTDRIPKYNRKLLKKYIEDFSSVSVRESNSVTLLSDLQKKTPIHHVLDPVLLVGKKFWENILPSIEYKEYVLLYFLDSPYDIEKIKSIIRRYPHKEVLQINTGITISEIPHTKIINPSPLEFVSLINHCNVMITDSFHGSAFSILFNKEFFTIKRSYKIFNSQNDRIISLLNLFQCPQRYIDQEFEVDNIKTIDYDKIREILKISQEQSLSFLKKALKKS